MKPIKDYLVFALDVPTRDDAVDWLAMLSGRVGFVKIGLELFIACGPTLIGTARTYGYQVILDLKLHDIPETVERAMDRIGSLGVRYATVHALGGPEMIRRAVAGAKGRTGVLAVTILTSHDEASLEGMGVFTRPTPLLLVRGLGHAVFTQPTPLLLVRRLGHDAVIKGGSTGLVCSAEELQSLRELLPASPEAVLMVPGIRLADGTANDQKRVATPQAAIARGADLLVIGRPIRDSKDPLDTLRQIHEHVEMGLAARADRGDDGV